MCYKILCETDSFCYTNTNSVKRIDNDQVVLPNIDLTEDDNMTFLTCELCQSTFAYGICFLLRPCSHQICVKCFHEAVPASYAMRCPCFDCQEWTTSSALFEVSKLKKNARQSPTRAATNLLDIPYLPKGNMTKFVQEVHHFEPDEQMDPFRHWAMKKPHLYSGFLYVAYRSSDEEASFYKTSFQSLDDTSVFMDDNSSNDLDKIFGRILHPLLFRRDFMENHIPRTSKTQNNLDLQQSKNMLSVREEQQELALRCLYALSSGRTMSTDKQDEIFNNENDLKTKKGIKKKAMFCAKKLAKELLFTKPKRRQTTPDNRTNLPQERDTSRSTAHPVTPSPTKDGKKSYWDTQNEQNEPFAWIPPDCEEENENHFEPEAPIPYALGFLLLSAAWMISN